MMYDVWHVYEIMWHNVPWQDMIWYNSVIRDDAIRCHVKWSKPYMTSFDYFFIYFWAGVGFNTEMLSPVIYTIRIRIRNLYCPYFTEKHQGTRKYINKDIWIPTHYKQTKKLSENTKQWYKIIEIQCRTKMTMKWLVHIVAYTTGHSCNNPPGGHRTRRGCHCSETI